MDRAPAMLIWGALMGIMAWIGVVADRIERLAVALEQRCECADRQAGGGGE